MSYRVKITLNLAARKEAVDTMRKRGIAIPDMFEGPVFERWKELA